MTPRSLSPGVLERAYLRADQLRAEAERKERAASRRIEALARGLAARVDPGMHLHRRGVGLHAFDADGRTCLAAAYLEEDGSGYRYRYAVLCGGEKAGRALRDAPLDPGESDEPGSTRRIAAASYEDYVDFVERLPSFLADLARALEARNERADGATEDAIRTRRKVAVVPARRAARPESPPAAGPANRTRIPGPVVDR